MATVEFKFAVGDKVYIIYDLTPDGWWKAKCYTVGTVARDEMGNKYLMRSGNREWLTEDNLVSAGEAKSCAISNCTEIMRQIAMFDFGE